MAAGEKIPPPVTQTGEIPGGDRRERVDQFPRLVSQTSPGGLRKLSRRAQGRNVDGAHVRRHTASGSAARVPGADLRASGRAMDHLLTDDSYYTGQRELAGREGERVG